ncbi:MAG: hypothetical protein AB1437_22810 [Pseudomonadota bacterium]
MMLLTAGISEAQINELDFVVFDKLNYVCSRLCHSYLLIEKGVPRHIFMAGQRALLQSMNRANPAL